MFLYWGGKIHYENRSICYLPCTFNRIDVCTDDDLESSPIDDAQVRAGDGF